MFDNFIRQARNTARRSARTAAIGLGASIALAVGLAFWTAAGWFFLLTQTTALNAAVIMGALYTGAGLIGFAVVSMRGSKPPEPAAPPPQSPPTVESLIAAFISGMNAGSRTRS